MLMWIFKRFNLNFAPFYIRNHKLIVSNLMMTSYPLDQITCVEFSTRMTIANGAYIGHFQILQRNGKRSRIFNFSTQLRLRSDSQVELNQYIQQLRNELTRHGIQNTIRN